MTISAYTEPQPANTAINEPPQSQETDEKVEPGAFAKILAGLLQKTGIENKPEDVQSADFSESEENIGFLSAEKTNAQRVLTESTPDDIEENGKNLNKILAEKELSEFDVTEDQMGILLNAENLLIRQNDQASLDTDAADGFLRDLSDIDAENLLLAGVESGADFSSLAADTAVTDEKAAFMAHNAGEIASARDSERLLLNEINVKKERDAQKNKSVNADNDSRKSEESVHFKKVPEKENPSRLDEVRSRSKRDKVTFEVRDLRTGNQERTNVGADTAGGRVREVPVREVTLELRLPDLNSENVKPGSAQTNWETRAGNALENMLARELHENFNGDIVRHASMALRDGGEGTIRLSLKPESLGNVKIHLELTENKITGQIVVESEEAMNAFKKEISSLEQAFRDSGFTNADLNLTYDSHSTEEQEQEERNYPQRIASSQYDDASSKEFLVDVFFGRRPGSINMFA